MEADDRDEDDQERVKRMVRSNNFTQQTNALDVDKHMYVKETASVPLASDQLLFPHHLSLALELIKG